MRSEFLRKIFCLMAAAIMVTAFACGEEEGDGDGDVDVDGKADLWDDRNNPARFGNNFEYNWEELQQYANGASDIQPWSDTYWPMTSDGYNWRWQGNSTMSPAELYDLTFNGWEPPDNFMELRPFRGARQEYDAEYYDVAGPATIWAHDGGLSRAVRLWSPDGTLSSSYQQCDTSEPPDNRFDSDAPDSCDLDGNDSVGSGDELGGLAGWFGHCHAWAPAAFSQPEPQHEVTVNGVTWTVPDIKAMIEATYEGCGGTLFLGGRCNLRELTRDENGRVVEDECRDTNAGSWHVVITNVMGILERSFVADITTDYQVWNHPVSDYSISLQEEVDEAAACALLGLDVQDWPYSNAERFVHVNMRMRYVVERGARLEPYTPDDFESTVSSRDYDYLLELDSAGDIIGGEWISSNQPDFLWAPTTNCDAREGWSNVVVSAANVQTLIDLSTSSEPPPPTGEGITVNSSLSAPLDIPDNDEAGASDTMNFPESMIIGGVRVNVNIPHTYIGDLQVTLSRGGDTVAMLHDRAGGGEDNLVASFDVSEFNGEDSRGDWTLHITDNAGIDTGALDNWSITIME